MLSVSNRHDGTVAIDGSFPTRAEVLSGIRNPPWRDPRFWVVQLLILVVVIGHLVLDLRHDPLPFGMPDSVVIGLILVPIIYAALSFGLGGAGASAAWCLVLMLPDLVFAESRSGLWVDCTLLLLATAGALAVGQRVDREVEARRRAAAAIQAHSAAEARYRAIFETNSAPTMVVDARGGVREANPAARALFGVDVTGRKLAELLGDEAAQGLLAQSPPRTVTVTREEGGTRTLQPLSTLVTDRGGDPLLQVILHDLTEEQERQRRIEAYAAQLVRAQEEERRRMAQDLHDEPLQTLIYLLRRLEYLGQSEALPASARDDLNATHSVLAQVVSDIRQMAQGLRPSGLDDLGLGAAVRHLVAEFAERSGIEPTLHISGVETGLAPELRTNLFRIVQEALTNVERHAEANHVDIEISGAPHAVTALVRDDGRGFAGDATAAGLGILGMEERATVCGGQLSIESHPGSGTAVLVTLPRPRDGSGVEVPAPQTAGRSGGSGVKSRRGGPKPPGTGA